MIFARMSYLSITMTKSLFLLLCALTLCFSIHAQTDSSSWYASKVQSLYHLHKNEEAYNTYLKYIQMPGGKADDLTTRMFLVAGMRALGSNALINRKPLMDSLESIIIRDARWLRVRADVYDALSRNEKDPSKAAEYTNLKNTDKVNYDSRYAPYDYKVIVPW